MNSTFNQVLFGQLKMTDVSGMLSLKDKMLHLMELNMNLLNGSLIANRTYYKQKDTPAHSFFDLKIRHLSISEAFQNFLTVQKFAPIAKNIQGSFSGNVEFVTDLDSMLIPVFPSFNSRGSLMIQKALVENFKPLEVMADILKMDKFKRLSIENIAPSYTIRDGRLNLAPLNFNIENTEFLISGSNGIDLSMDYLMKLKVPAKELSDQSNAVINNIFHKKLDLLQEDQVVLDVTFQGTIDNPNVNVSGRDILTGATDKLIDLAKQEVLKHKSVLPDTLRTEMDKQKAQLEQQRKEAEAKAKSEQERLKKEAENKFKSLFERK
ncbi:hypothetical protein JW979_08225 [bacterium]|nr:hypothetical protein [candidate division CSSED10-310 bacterium]